MKNGLAYPEMKQEMDELQEKKNTLIEEIKSIKNKNYLSTISASRIKQDLINKIQNLDDATIDVAIKLYVKGIRVNKNHSMDVLIGFRKDSSSAPLSNEEKEQISKHLNTMSNSGSPGRIRTYGLSVNSRALHH